MYLSASHWSQDCDAARDCLPCLPVGVAAAAEDVAAEASCESTLEAGVDMPVVSVAASLPADATLGSTDVGLSV